MSKNHFGKFWNFDPGDPILTWAKKWPKWCRNDFSRAFERCLSFFSTATGAEIMGGGVQTPPPPSRRWKIQRPSRARVKKVTCEVKIRSQVKCTCLQKKLENWKTVENRLRSCAVSSISWWDSKHDVTTNSNHSEKLPSPVQMFIFWTIRVVDDCNSRFCCFNNVNWCWLRAEYW